MPSVVAPNSLAKSMKGFHLYHAGLSNCSQRVRLVFEEKEVSWTSHLVNLAKLENLSDEYTALNPRGLVPTLVHNGNIITESADIIRYVDNAFPGTPLQPKSDEDRNKVNAWLDAVENIQRTVKILTYEFLLKPKGMFGPTQVKHYLRHQKNREQAQFIKEFAAGFSNKLIESCIGEVDNLCTKLESTLHNSTYLVGEDLSLADIAVVVNIHRFKLLKLKGTDMPEILRWYQLMQARPSFKPAISDFAI